MKALSIKQPWAWLIIHGGKDIENRTWKMQNTYGFVLRDPKPLSFKPAKGQLNFFNVEQD